MVLTKIKSQIGIIGCGWLGLPLAEHLTELGYKTKGTTTSDLKLESLSSKGILPFKIVLTEEKVNGDIDGFLEHLETLVINIPPRLRKHPYRNHVDEIRHLVSKIEKNSIKNILFISSTSVFKDEEDFPTITDEVKPNGISNSAKQLIEIENMLLANPSFRTTVLRFSGLFDDVRHPAYVLSGKTDLKNANAPVNLIHKDDCIAIIAMIIEDNVWGLSFNAATPYHPTKKVYYTSFCEANNLAVPNYNSETKSKGKKIDSSTLVRHLNYSFKRQL